MLPAETSDELSSVRRTTVRLWCVDLLTGTVEIGSDMRVVRVDPAAALILGRHSNALNYRHLNM